MKDRDVLFHEKWLGLAQPIEGLVFSVPVLADAQIAPELKVELSTAFAAHVGSTDPPRIRSIEPFLRDFLGYRAPGMLVPRAELPPDLSFYAEEGGQELRPSFALGRGPFESDDPFAAFEKPREKPAEPAKVADKPWFALVWDLTETGTSPDLDSPESVTGPWRYPPTQKFERLLRHVAIPVGLLFNGPELRLVYAPSGESSAHLTFRVEHLVRPDGRPLLAALDLLLHARRAYGASPDHTLEGLLKESRRRQADVTEELAKQVFEAVEVLVAGFEAAAKRDTSGGRDDWLRTALEEPGDHFYQGVLGVVLRLVFLLYAEDQNLMPMEQAAYAEHLSLFRLYARLKHDAAAHPESMHHRFGAYGQLVALFRAVFFGVKHKKLVLPPRRGRLFDPNTFPFLEGGLPGWTAAVVDPKARAAAVPPSLDDGTVYRVLHRLIIFEGQRLSYRTLDVEQIGSIYESLMGFHVLRLGCTAVRIGKHGVWVESDAVRAMSRTDRARFFKETCGLNPGPVQSLEKALKEAKDPAEVLEALSAQAVGRKADILRHRAGAGHLVLQPGEERRRTASHYTPRSLTEKVVKRTLEPLLACLGPERSPEQILQLKICDPAMGSGAFLVATCRELATEIEAAWQRRGELARIVEQYGDARLHASRLVAQKCLYGVDKNAAAVELAKLSLWLITLSRDLPFTFVDHALRHGDSLVGLDFKQIEAFHWAPSGQVEMCRLLLRDALDEAVGLRQQILELADRDDPVSQGEKRRLFEFAQQAIDRVRTVADVCVGAFFAEGKDAAREKERKRRLALVEQWMGGDVEAGREVRVLGDEAKGKLSPFHWWIEFPEVFFEERPDPLQGGVVNGAALMEGVVGNPPFAGKNMISSSHPDGYIGWLQSINAESHGNADLCAHFFRRAGQLIGDHGAIGLIGTNTIAQGDTRRSSLQPLLRSAFIVYRAEENVIWPGNAAVVVTLLHLATGFPALRLGGRIVLNDRGVPCINSFLRGKTEAADARALFSNADLSLVGSFVAGAGFILEPAEAKRILKSDSRNKEVVRRYIGGEDFSRHPAQASSRYIIDFGSAGLEVAKQWPEPLAIVEQRVKPTRAEARHDRREYWWLFAGRAPEIRAYLERNGRVLSVAQTSPHRAFAFVGSEYTIANTLIVILLHDWTAFACLQSRVHAVWVDYMASSFKEDIRYTPSDCFDTFPFPARDPNTVLEVPGDSGRTLYDARAKYMVDTDQGLTKTYNALKDPACTESRILELRRLHETMDRTVLDAYGWTDITVPPYCALDDTDKQALQTFEDEIIDRLYVLNAERAREEERLGLTGKKAKRAKETDDDTDPADGSPEKPARKRKTKSKKDTKDQGKLFE